MTKTARAPRKPKSVDAIKRDQSFYVKAAKAWNAANSPLEAAEKMSLTLPQMRAVAASLRRAEVKIKVFPRTGRKPIDGKAINAAL